MAHPRLLLFGSPGAGKSSLLGALAQAAALDAPALQGKLVDKSGELDNLQKLTYQGKTAATASLEEYDIRLDSDASVAATLIDCSGKQADELLKAEQPFADRHPMRRPILDADAVLMLVDVSKSGKELVDEFQQLGNWLQHLHETRGRRTDVGDLPVFLVLTKCDALGKKEEPFARWIQRIDEAKKKVDDKFHEFFKGDGTGFGSIDLKLWATSIKRPQLADRAAKAAEPYGVAELFRESVDAAADHQHRRYTSQRRLQNVTVGLLGSLAMLLVTVGFLFEYPPGKAGTPLDEQALRVLPKSDVAAVRLGGALKKLEEKRTALEDIQKDPAFSRLPSETQSAIAQYRKDIDEYLTLTEQVKTQAKYPFAAKTEEEFTAQEKSANEFAYPKDWDDTPLARQIRDVRGQYKKVREELKAEEAWMHTQKDQTEKLRQEGRTLHGRLLNGMKVDPETLKSWEVNARAQMNPKRVRLGDGIPGVPGVTFQYLDRFTAIKNARKDWDASKLKLASILRSIQDEIGAMP